jgi:DNA gyrase subunit B
MRQFPRDTRQYPTLRARKGTLEVQAAPGLKALTYRGVIEGETDDYLVFVQFFGISFSDKQDATHTLNVKHGGKDIYYQVPSVGTNQVMVKCSCFTGETLVMLADGTSRPISELAGKDRFHVFAFDERTKRIVIAEAVSCRKTSINQEIVEVEFDNGEKVRCTPDHRFLRRDGSWVEAQHLVSGDSMEAIYRRSSDASDGLKRQDYEMVLQRSGWEFSHYLADEYNIRTGLYSRCNGNTRHHVDFNRRNNNPSNILRMPFAEHRKLHQDRMVENNPMKDRSVAVRVRDKNIANGVFDVAAERMRTQNPMHQPEALERMINTSRERGYSNKERMVEIASKRTADSFAKIGEGRRRAWKQGDTAGLEKATEVVRERVASGTWHLQGEEHRVRARGLMAARMADPEFRAKSSAAVSSSNRARMNDPESLNALARSKAIAAVREHIMRHGSLGCGEFKPGKGRPTLDTIQKTFNLDEIVSEATNHKIVAVRKLVEREDVYCLSVPGYENFAIDVDRGNKDSSGVFVHNCPDYRFRWEKPNYDAGALIGRWRPYTRKTPKPPLGYPYANPFNLPGFCKHIYAMLSILNRLGRVRE